MVQIKKIFCNTCKTETNHEIGSVHYRYCQNNAELKNLVFVETIGLDEPIDFKNSKGIFKYETWICRGCDTVTLQESCAINGLTYDKGMKVVWSYDFHPLRESESLPERDLGLTPIKLYLLYHEVLESYKNELPVLCSIGLRALLEGICKDKGISDKDARALADKVDELAKRQHLPPAIAKNLKSYKFIGDSAAHYLEAPDRESLKVGIEVMQDLLNYLYVLEYKSEWLSELISDNKNIKRKRE
jgi:hypothetical protein